MDTTLVLRFRDLVTEPGGTVLEHQQLLKRYGEVWWGWWMKQYETVPRDFFADVSRRIEFANPAKALLYNSGAARVYTAAIARIAVSPMSEGVSTPEPEKSPAYYHRGRCTAWFLLTQLEPADDTELEILRYHSFPTRPDDQELLKLCGTGVGSALRLRDDDVTLWVLRPDQ